MQFVTLSNISFHHSMDTFNWSPGFVRAIGKLFEMVEILEFSQETVKQRKRILEEY